MTEPSSGPPTERSGIDRLLMQGIAWTAVLRFAAQVVSWTGTVIAARILTPGDYGLFGMAMLAIGLVRMVEDFGMDAVLVQDRSIVEHQQARLAGFVLLVGIVFALVFVGLSRPIAAFFEEPQVALLVAVLGTWCIADALQVIPRATLQKELDYRRLAIAQFVQTFTMQSILVTGALLGWGVWSLVFDALGGATAVTILLCYWRPFAIRWPRQLRELAKPLLQGWRILASRFAWYAYTSADQTIIGKFIGKDGLGAYQQAQALSTAISQEISAVMSRVVPGVFSTVQGSYQELRRYFSLLTELLCYATFPVLLGTAVLADLAVAIVLGPQWEATVAPLRILCLYGTYYSCQVLVGHVLMWTGRFRANMWCSILAAAIMPASFYVGSHWGLVGVAWAWVIAYPIANLPGFVIAFRIIKINGWKWLALFLPALTACALMTAAVLGVRAAMPADVSVWVDLAVSAATGAVVYIGALLLFFRSRVWRMIEFVKSIRSTAKH